GDFDFILKVVTDRRKNLEEILNHIKSIDGVSFTRTSVVLSENKNEVCILPEKNNW
ncbi:MAG: Lrp/AsnC ligand binding domain-containing protein, partial [Clostridia bacterium]|nr:Lrp/AsnC ligand binding domain-containing protein [Clostridia bacterium]